MILIFSQIVITIATPIIIKIIKGWKGCQKKLNKLSHNEHFLIDILFNL